MTKRNERLASSVFEFEYSQLKCMFTKIAILPVQGLRIKE